MLKLKITDYRRVEFGFCVCMYRETDWQSDGQAGRQTGSQTGRQEGSQTGRQSDRQTGIRGLYCEGE